MALGEGAAGKITQEDINQSWNGAEVIRLDIDPLCNPDVLWDLNNIPLPFSDNSMDEIHAYEVLEHVGRQGDWKFFFDEFTDFWRILVPGGNLFFHSPMWDSVGAWGDPGHTRVFSWMSLVFLNQLEYRAGVGKTSMTDYRWYYKADFDVSHFTDKGIFYGILRAVKPSRIEG